MNNPAPSCGVSELGVKICLKGIVTPEFLSGLRFRTSLRSAQSNHRLKHVGMRDFGKAIYLTQQAAGNQPTNIEKNILDLISKSMLAIPTLGAGMKRHIDGRRFGVPSELAQARVCPLVPGNQFLSFLQCGADKISLLVWQRRARIERPAAEVETDMIGNEVFVTPGGQHNPPPADRFQLP